MLSYNWIILREIYFAIFFFLLSISLLSVPILSSFEEKYFSNCRWSYVQKPVSIAEGRVQYVVVKNVFKTLINALGSNNFQSFAFALTHSLSHSLYLSYSLTHSIYLSFPPVRFLFYISFLFSFLFFSCVYNAMSNNLLCLGGSLAYLLSL